VNYEHYRKIRNEDDRREYQKNLMRDRRAAAKAKQEAAELTDETLAAVSNVSPGSKQYAVSSKQEADTDTNNTHAALATFLDRLPEPSRPHVAALARAQKRPESWAAAMSAELDGMHGTPIPAPLLAQALTEMAATDATPSAANVRAFVRRLKTDSARDAAAPRKPGTTGRESANIDVLTRAATRWQEPHA
jgi:hypothetical protein